MNIFPASFYSDLVFAPQKHQPPTGRAAHHSDGASFALVLDCTALVEQEDRAVVKHQMRVRTAVRNPSKPFLS